ncbi:MAG TPA: EscU/YscU/HrcU family type III secretion system export apparatus switch protein, partial [Planctomycetaceae bacterium]|nr:EscU/YscU/HrcU family type III secretion system export apparatus switch protein [Planctomycetaceae bacterium]
MPEQHGDKSQEPTPHRRQKAREEGHVAKSQDLASAVLLLVGTAALWLLGGPLAGFLDDYSRQHLGGEAWVRVDPDLVVVQCRSALSALTRYVLPLMAVMMVAGIAAHLAQSGFLFLPGRLSPDITRIDPLRGFGRLASITNIARLGFGLFKVVVIAAVSFVSLYGHRETILALPSMAAETVAVYVARIMLSTMLQVALALVVLAILDYAFQRWKYEQDLRMTPQEVREELKNLEGDPHIAARRKVVQRQLVLNRISAEVPKADVVITNPTELAVAIRYDPEAMAAPVVVAKGA